MKPWIWNRRRVVGVGALCLGAIVVIQRVGDQSGRSGRS